MVLLGGFRFCVQVVKLMDGLNRFRFAKDPELLAAWASASNVLATPRPAEPKPGPGSPEGRCRRAVRSGRRHEGGLVGR